MSGSRQKEERQFVIRGPHCRKFKHFVSKLLLFSAKSLSSTISKMTKSYCTNLMAVYLKNNDFTSEA